MSCKGIIDSLLPSIDSILGIRDTVGAVILPVFFVTHTWSGSTIGDGTLSTSQVQMLPTPNWKSFSQDLRLKEGGVIKEGDILLTNVSRNKFKESDLDGLTNVNNVEKFLRVGDKLYRVVSVVPKYLTWEILLREQSNRRGI